MLSEPRNPPIDRLHLKPLAEWLREEGYMTFRSFGPSILETESGRERARQVIALNMAADLLEGHMQPEETDGVNRA